METPLERLAIRVGAALAAALITNPFGSDLGADPLNCLPPPDCKGPACCKFDREKDIDFAIKLAGMRRNLYTDPKNAAAARKRALDKFPGFTNQGVKLDANGNFDVSEVALPPGAQELLRQRCELEASALLHDIIDGIISDATSRYVKKAAEIAAAMGATAESPNGGWTMNHASCTSSPNDPKAVEADRKNGKVCVEVLDAVAVHEHLHEQFCAFAKQSTANAAALEKAFGVPVNSVNGTAQDERRAYEREALELRKRKDDAYKRCTTGPFPPNFEQRKKKAADDYAAAKKAYDSMMGGIDLTVDGGGATPTLRSLVEPAE